MLAVALYTLNFSVCCKEIFLEHPITSLTHRVTCGAVIPLYDVNSRELGKQERWPQLGRDVLLSFQMDPTQKFGFCFHTSDPRTVQTPGLPVEETTEEMTVLNLLKKKQKRY